MYEPTSLAKLSKKGAEMHDASLLLKVSPRGGERRPSHHYREIPADTIPENTNAHESSSEEEEKKEEPEAAQANPPASELWPVFVSHNVHISFPSTSHK